MHASVIESINDHSMPFIYADEIGAYRRVCVWMTHRCTDSDPGAGDRCPDRYMQEM